MLPEPVVFLRRADGGHVRPGAGRTRSRLDIPAIRTIFCLKNRRYSNRKDGWPAQEIVIKKPRYGLNWFRISFGRLQLNAYTKCEHLLRFEVTVHCPRQPHRQHSVDRMNASA